MVKARKFYVLLEAFLVALFLFSFGILMGIFIENSRTSALEQNFGELETEILDARIISELISSSECQLAINENIAFADRVFWEAKELDKYEKSSQITDSIKIQHRKYDLLRTIIWMNSIKIKDRCNADYHTVVYIYNYDNPSITEKAKQEAISNLLGELKDTYGDKVLLLSLAGDGGSPSIDLLREKYNLTDLPVVFIDEQFKVVSVENMKAEIEQYLD